MCENISLHKKDWNFRNYFIPIKRFIGQAKLIKISLPFYTLKIPVKCSALNKKRLARQIINLFLQIFTQHNGLKYSLKEQCYFYAKMNFQDIFTFIFLVQSKKIEEIKLLKKAVRYLKYECYFRKD